MKLTKKIITRLLAVAVVVPGVFLLVNIANAAVESETLETGVMFVLDDTNYGFRDYWNEESGKRTVPVKEDYVFGGWFSKDSEGNYVPLKEAEITDDITSAYAKFVPSYVLSVKAQNQNGTSEGDGPQTSVRLLSSVDSKNYQSVGFHILLNNVISVGTCENIDTYASIKAGYGGLTEAITANQVFGAASSYFNVWRLNNIHDANDSKIIYARPYWVTMDGTKVEGLAKYVHVEDDYKNYISVPVNLLTGEAVAAGAVDITYESEKLDIVDIKTGRIFGNMQFDHTSKAGTIKMVGYAKPKLNEGKLVDAQADGIYASVRFIEKEGKDADGTHFNMMAKDFCNWDEDLIKTVKVWDVTYMNVKQTGMDKADSKAVSFDFIGGDLVMPIAGYYGPYPFYVSGYQGKHEEILYITDDMFKAIADMGINLILYSDTDYNRNKDKQAVIDTLNFGEKHGIGIFVTDSFVHGKAGSESISVSDLKNRIANYAEYPAFCGMYLVDEPSTSYYMQGEDDTNNIDKYGLLANALQYDLDLYCHMNMYPWSRTSGEKEAYDQYVNEFCNTLKPRILSWDKYPFESSDTLDVYFYNMSLMREKSEQYHVPFWAAIQAGGNWTNANATPPNEAQFYWNVNTCLAFGAQGIHYFPLLQPMQFANSGTKEEPIWDYDKSGLIGADGKPNSGDDAKANGAWYDYAKSINKQIAAVDEVLMNAKNLGVIVNAAEEGEKGEAWFDIEEVKSVLDDTTLASCVLKAGIDTEYYVEKGFLDYKSTNTKPDTGLVWQELRNVDGDVLIGCFNYNGKTALYVVNYDMDSEQKITLNFDETHAIRMTRKAATTTQTADTWELTMDAGEGVLLVLE